MSARAEPWSFSILPDTQVYARYHPELFVAQTRWLADNAARLALAFVLHVGDVTDTASPAEWRVAHEAFAHLDRARVPYLVAPGNHDLEPGGSASSRDTELDQLYPPELAAAGETFLPGRMSNRWMLFDTPAGPWLGLALEFAPRERVLDWAREVVERHAPTPAVVVSHAHLYSDATRYDRATRKDQQWSPYVYGVARDEPIADGARVFERLVLPCPSIRFVVCGHVLNEGVARLSTMRPDGSRVHELCANYQTRDRGGNARLRLVTVDSARAVAHVRTYSPVSDTFETDDANEFVLPL